MLNIILPFSSFNILPFTLNITRPCTFSALNFALNVVKSSILDLVVITSIDGSCLITIILNNLEEER